MPRKKKQYRYFRYNWRSDPSMVRDKNGNTIYYETYADAVEKRRKGEMVLKEEIPYGT